MRDCFLGGADVSVLREVPTNATGASSAAGLERRSALQILRFLYRPSHRQLQGIEADRGSRVVCPPKGRGDLDLRGEYGDHCGLSARFVRTSQDSSR